MNQLFRRPALRAICLLAVALAGLLAACGTASETKTSSTTPSTLRIGMQASAIKTLNPFLAGYSGDVAAYNFQYPMLTQFDSNNTLQPGLAKSWSTSPDGKTWTFNLVNGAKWTDGQPITAEDAAFTINTVVRLKDGVAANISIYAPGIVKAWAPDPLTLKVELEAPQSAFLSNTNGLPVLPMHVWEPLAKGDGNKIKTFTGDPKDGPVVVSGPFVVEKWDPNGTTIFTRVDSYYGPKPKISRWGWQVFTNSDAAVQALTSGQIDIVAGVPATAVDPIKSSANLTVEGFGLGELGIFMKYRDSNHPELQNPQVREALNLAIDRSGIVSSAFRGFATAGGTLFPPAWSPQYLSSPLPVPAFDVAKANQILDGLGYKRGSDGVRVANGRKMTYQAAGLSSRRDTYGRAADSVKQTLSQIGVQFQFDWVDDPYTAYMGSNYDYKSDYEAYFGGVLLTPDPDASLLMFTTDQLGVYNLWNYSNTQLDKLYSEQSANYDQTSRRTQLDEATGILQTDQVELGLVWQQTVVGWDSRWRNVSDLAGINGWPNILSQDGFANISY